MLALLVLAIIALVLCAVAMVRSLCDPVDTRTQWEVHRASRRLAQLHDQAVRQMLDEATRHLSRRR